MGGRSGKRCKNQKPSAPCLTGKPPGRIQQQIYSTKVNGIAPEKTRLAGLPYRSHLTLKPVGKGSVTVHSTAHT